jgi:hypothetical protein
VNDNGAVPTLSPTPTFLGHTVLIDYAPALANPQAVHRSLCAIVRRAEEGHARVDQLIAGIKEGVEQYGYTARVIGRMPGTIEFAVTRE